MPCRDNVTIEVLPYGSWSTAMYYKQVEPPAPETPDPRQWTLTIGPDPAELLTLILEESNDEPLPEEKETD